ncbi:hypothetical protein ACFFSW_30940 [Saccharothrix longispora]|uniref:NAD(P)-dependent dehydrogenase (Short-subunit alcohol dehydrogenase family) n=1 Tax=Saccharothrix longispora TaxID=33920 RepID=A0ABU1PUD8_9PSEU|nr:hypothetical protein [Saccharothrix longispora]MDR6594255.1 NAD(P)-dependent dehydrogenase (short-subunit alcohol dehydrogenase family) [Saccharothrix longispora]
MTGAFGRLDVAFDDAGVEQPVEAAAEIAAAALWPRSDEAAFTVGHAVVVDGGRTA